MVRHSLLNKGMSTTPISLYAETSSTPRLCHTQTHTHTTRNTHANIQYVTYNKHIHKTKAHIQPHPTTTTCTRKHPNAQTRRITSTYKYPKTQIMSWVGAVSYLQLFSPHSICTANTAPSTTPPSATPPSATPPSATPPSTTPPGQSRGHAPVPVPRSESSDTLVFLCPGKELSVGNSAIHLPQSETSPYRIRKCEDVLRYTGDPCGVGYFPKSALSTMSNSSPKWTLSKVR